MHWRRRAAVVSLGLLSVAVAAVSISRPWASGDSGVLAVVENGMWSLADGTALSIPSGAEGADPTKAAWSPDGTELAFACDPDTLSADVDGKGLCSATTSGATLWSVAAAPVRFPVWSSNGEELAYAALGHAGHGSLWVSRRGESGEDETLCEEWCPLFRYYSLAWSPDGETLAAVAETPGTGGHPARIILFDVETHDFEFLNDKLPGLQHGPTWSPDGRHLAFSSNAEGDFDIWSVELESRTAQRLTSEANGALNPAWSPDGSEIAFLSRAPGQGTTVRSVSTSGGPSTEVVQAGDLRTPRFVAIER